MAKPVYRIETERNGSNIYTITDEGVSLHVKLASVEQIGNFTFTLPSAQGLDTKYGDLQNYDLVKIWLNWDSVNANEDPLFTGRIENIDEGGSTQLGYVTKITGGDEGCVANNHLKVNRRWCGVQDDLAKASEIIKALATELGISYDVDVDNHYVTQTISTEPYMDTIRRLCDFWADGGTQLKKDLYFKNVAGTIKLFYKNRPVRTEGVETLVLGENLDNYRRIRDSIPVKNKIRAFGKQEERLPPSTGSDTEAWEEPSNGWTESLTGWYGFDTPILSSTAKYGTYSIEIKRLNANANAILGLSRSVNHILVKDNALLNFSMTIWANPGKTISITYAYVQLTTPLGVFRLRLYPVHPTYPPPVWMDYSLKLGPPYEVRDAFDAMRMKWDRYIGAPTWYDLTLVTFTVKFVNDAATDLSFIIDGLHFEDLRWNGLVENTSSQTAYGVREMEYMSDTLHSDAECIARAQTLLSQQKNPVTQLVLNCRGTKNILLGDRLPVTIPRINYISKLLDVYNVEHTLDQNGWVTTTNVTDTVDIRKPSESSNNVAFLRGISRAISDLNKQIQNIR
jgi:hypothetical protein